MGMTTSNVGALVSPKTLKQNEIKKVDPNVKVVEIVPKTIEEELKDLKKEVARLNKIVGLFQRFYSNWHKYKHHLGLT